MPKSLADELAALSVADVKRRFEDRDPTRAEKDALLADPRAGVRAVAAALDRKRVAEQAAERSLTERLKFEKALWDAGLTLVAGCDEAGVSPLAGPVVAGACILRVGDRIPGVDDSKKLSKEQRERLAVEIKARAVSWAVGLATPAEIDEINILQANHLAMRRAILGLSPRPQHVLMDARQLKDLGIPQTPIIKGDALSMTIGAASILAKTHRDALMVALDAEYPGYGFAVHKGYPVAAHVEALRRLGASPVHRRSFAPVREVLDGGPRQKTLF